MPELKNKPNFKLLEKKWLEKWPKALELWSKYTRLKEPFFCLNSTDEKLFGLSSSFAMIRLNDHKVVVSLPQIHELNLEDYALEILAHEIGHHVYCPADLSDMARLLARVRRGLPTVEHYASLVANLYTDLLINDRLFREQGLKLDRLYQQIKVQSSDQLWNFYLRIYEILWSLPALTLTSVKISGEMEADAQLGNRLVRNYAKDWLKGAGRFAALCLTYLILPEMAQTQKQISIILDTQSAGVGDFIPDGICEIDEDEINGALHPSLEEKSKTASPQGEMSTTSNSGGNYREPFEYGQILKSLGIQLNDRDLAVKYYRERALPYLIPFPTLEKPKSQDPLPEGFSVWDIGSSMENINWVETATRSPVIVPGYTVYEQIYGISEGNDPQKDPIDLDLYVDCSGSMPNPAVNVSYLTLAGAIIAISALRVGAKVQATLWSGTNQFETTPGFISDEQQILQILTGYFGGGTAFPIHILRDTYLNRSKNSRKVHILVISDDGVTTMFDKDEQNNSGREIAKTALLNAGGGGTLVLNLYSKWENIKELVFASKLGFDIATIQSWPDLIQFSKNFAKKHYGKGEA